MPPDQGHATPVVLLAGPIAVGKSSAAQQLSSDLCGEVISARQALIAVLGLSADAGRATLQREGADLDRRTRGTWLVDYLAERIETAAGPIVLDSLRTVRQTEPILRHLHTARLIYLDAHAATRRQRYAAGSVLDSVKRSVPFDEAMNHPTEQSVTELRALAALVLETDDLTVGEVVDLIKERLRD